MVLTQNLLQTPRAHAQGEWPVSAGTWWQGLHSAFRNTGGTQTLEEICLPLFGHRPHCAYVLPRMQAAFVPTQTLCRPTSLDHREVQKPTKNRIFPRDMPRDTALCSWSPLWSKFSICSRLGLCLYTKRDGQITNLPHGCTPCLRSHL